MVWLLGLGLLVWGCDHGNAAVDGGGSTGSGQPTCGPPPPGSQLCGSTCGNGSVDACFRPTMLTQHCTVFVPAQEACDSAAPPGQTCDSLGYYGGALGCTADCTGPDPHNCGVCAPAITCATTYYGGRAIAVSGNHAASLGNQTIQFFVGTTPTMTLTEDAQIIVATAAGWLVEDGQGLRTLAFDGTLGTPQPPLASTFGPGPGDRLTAVVMNDPMTEVQLVDQTGTGVTTPVAVFAGTNRLGIASDGIHAFIGGVGTLATLAQDGTATTVTGLPSDDVVDVTWDGTTGWYVTATTAQRFDSAGALVGAAIALPAVTVHAIADGADLVTVRMTGTKISTQRVHADGSADAAVEIGAGSGTPLAARLAGQIVLNWSTVAGAVLAVVPS